MLLFGIIAAAVAAADLTVKYFASNFLQPVRSVSLIDGIFSLTYVENRGAAFGIMQNKQYLFIIFTVVVLAFIILFLWRGKRRSMFFNISLAFIFGGAVGNLIDRLRLGYVVDLFDFELINFPVFNVADIFVCVGVALAFICILLEKDEI